MVRCQPAPLGRAHPSSLRRTAMFGLGLLTLGVISLFGYAYLRDWAAYGLVTPLLIAVGATLVGYPWRLDGFVDRLLEKQARSDTTNLEPSRPTPVHTGASLSAHRTAVVLICVVIAAGIFRAVATIAQWTGRGIAEYQAQHLSSLPSVVLDTRERLFLRDPGIDETQLPASEGQTYHYRYRGLRLLIEGQDRMFLVPDQWSASDSTLIVLLDESVRVQFQFQNQPP